MRLFEGRKVGRSYAAVTVVEVQMRQGRGGGVWEIHFSI